MTTTLTACVLVPDLLLHLAAQHVRVRPPFAVVDDTALARVRQCCPHAAAAGVTPGMPAFLAKQHCPHLTTTTLAAALVDTTRATITALLGQQGDHVHGVGSTGWGLHVLALGPQYHLAPGVAGELQHAVRAATGLRPIVVLAPTATTARIAAQHAAAGRHTTPLVIVPGDEAAFLAPLAVAHVPGVGTQTAARLAQFGITTIGAFAALPTATVVQLLGARGGTLQAAARGADVSISGPLLRTRHGKARGTTPPLRVPRPPHFDVMCSASRSGSGGTCANKH